MDLIGAARALRAIADVFGDGPDAGEPWAADEDAFRRHFGIGYEHFCERVQLLDEEQSARLDATMEVNPEAAVLWVMSMEPVK